MTKKRLIFTPIALLFMGVAKLLHFIPVKRHHYLLSSVCHPKLLLNSGVEHRNETYRLVLGQKGDYDKRLQKLRELNFPQYFDHFDRQSGREYSTAAVRFYIF